MYNLTNLTVADVVKCRQMLRELGDGAKSLEELAVRIVQYFYNLFGDDQTGEHAIALSRLYKTCSYEKLDSEFRDFAQVMLGSEPATPDLKCLTLLATTGERIEWNSPRRSAGHKAIPLPSEKVVTQLPMIAQLVKQFGLTISEVLRPNPNLIRDMAEKTYNVFHVEEAVGSKYVPAQEGFVIPYGIKSVVGFGGILPQGELYAVILFSKQTISKEVADQFKVLALGVKTLILAALW
ncbi:MAG: hypothetical protein AB1489_29700 [Acidobacteriota bacterium]